ncbi:MAG: Fe-S protein assembly co-chaperone HscB [Planctomycetota bacterium]|jgi:molecular chaperone HscB
MNPFAVLGLEPRMDLPVADLEQAYLSLSRETHPDANPGVTAEEQVQILSRSADINDAYKVLKDPWRRARAILQLRQPGIMDQTKHLDPAFLMDAMEQAEAVARCDAADRPALLARLDARVQECLAQITAAIDQDHDREAAVLLHQARYHQKAHQDLKAPEEGESL